MPIVGSACIEIGNGDILRRFEISGGTWIPNEPTQGHSGGGEYWVDTVREVPGGLRMLTTWIYKVRGGGVEALFERHGIMAEDNGGRPEVWSRWARVPDEATARVTRVNARITGSREEGWRLSFMRVSGVKVCYNIPALYGDEKCFDAKQKSVVKQDLVECS